MPSEADSPKLRTSGKLGGSERARDLLQGKKKNPKIQRTGKDTIKILVTYSF